MTTYEGECIGGPWSGEIRRHGRPRLRVAQPHWDEPERLVIVGHYVHQIPLCADGGPNWWVWHAKSVRVPACLRAELAQIQRTLRESLQAVWDRRDGRRR